MQVRGDSEFADWVATEQALAYRVVVSIEERNVGVSVLELAFRTDNDKAPYRIWCLWEYLQPYTDDETITTEYEERRARGLSQRHDVLAAEVVSTERRRVRRGA